VLFAAGGDARAGQPPDFSLLSIEEPGEVLVLGAIKWRR
jgi:hypothetical protein